jgi:hypothetical protein
MIAAPTQNRAAIAHFVSGQHVEPNSGKDRVDEPHTMAPLTPKFAERSTDGDDGMAGGSGRGAVEHASFRPHVESGSSR